MPIAALPAKNHRPNEGYQRNQQKSAKIDQDFRNSGSGGNQFPERIPPIDIIYPSQ